MGYTHYFKQVRSATKAEWKLICVLFRGACSLLKSQGNMPEVRYEFDSDKPMVINGNYIRFNGVGAEGCDTMILRRVPRGESWFDYCKTNRRPYDHLVLLLLIIAKQVTQENDEYGPAWEIQSDAGSDDLDDFGLWIRQTEIMFPGILGEVRQWSARIEKSIKARGD